MATKQEVVSVIERMSKAFRNFQPQSIEAMKDQAEIWVEKLAVYPGLIVQQAGEFAIENYKFFPAMSEMLSECKRVFAVEIERCNSKWLNLRDPMLHNPVGKKPARTEFEKLAQDWRRIGRTDQADFVLKYYEDYKDREWTPPSPEKVEAFRQKCAIAAKKMSVRE